MSLINVTNLTFAYPGTYDNIFENVSFQMDTDWKLGFTGRNGRGKTTFLQLLMGKYAYSGKISCAVKLMYFPYDVPDKSVSAEAVAQSACPEHPRWKLVRELHALNLPEEILARPFASLSNGEQTKVMLAALFLNEDSFLLIDEPTNHLDAPGREVVSAYLKTKPGFILISHDRRFLDGCVDHILSINKTGIEVERGNFSSWYANKERRDNFELAENEKQKKEIARLKEAAQKKADWADKGEKAKHTRISGLRPDRGHMGRKAAKVMKQAKNLEQRRDAALEEKAKLLQNLETAESLKLSQLPYYTSPLLSLEGVSVVYGGRRICENVSFAVEKGDRISLAGPNGSGKTSLLRLACGFEVPHTGVVRKGPQLRISYVAQDTSALSGSLTAYAEKSGIDESLFKAILRKLGFERVQFEKDMTAFSGGQKKIVLIARSLCETTHLLVWDEPMNYIDVIARMQMEELLLKYKPTMLFVEHDKAFVENIATKTVQL